jgi:hypothetical protein
MVREEWFQKSLIPCSRVEEEVGSSEVTLCKGSDEHTLVDLYPAGVEEGLKNLWRTKAKLESRTSLGVVCKTEHVTLAGGDVEVCTIKGDIPVLKPKLAELVTKLTQEAECRIRDVHVHSYSPGGGHWFKEGFTRGVRYDDYPDRGRGLTHVYHIHPECRLEGASRDRVGNQFMRLVRFSREAWE